MASNNSRPFTDKPDLLPGQQEQWWRAPAKGLRQARLLRKLEQDKLEATTDTIGGLTISANQVLVFNGTTFVPTSLTALISLTDLTDVVLTSPSTNQFLRYNGTSWTNQSVTIVTDLDSLSDVTLTSPATGALLVKTAGDWIDQNYTPGKLGVGTAGDPTLRLELADVDHTAWFTGASTLGSATSGWRMSKDKTKTAKLIGYALHTDGAPCWELAMAGDTNNALNSGFGNADVGLYDYSAGGFALRVSPEEAASAGTGTKFFFGRNATTPKAFTSYVTMQSPANGLTTLAVKQKASQTASLQEWQDSSSVPCLSVAAAGHLTFAEAINIAFGTTTGTKIGTGTTQKFGFYDATPIAQQAQTVDLRTVFINLGLIASASGATPLSLNGGNLDGNQATLSAGIRGSGGAISLGTSTVTFTADADQALTSAEMATAHIIIAAGAHPIAPQALTTPTTTGGIYLVQNLNAQTITFKTAAGTGVAIPTGGILICRVGANIVSLKPTV